MQENYDRERAQLAKRLHEIDWDTYVGFDAELKDFVVINDQVQWAPLRSVRTLMLERLVRTVERHVRSGETVLEFGSGDGRNVLYLRKRFPNLKFVGLELSPTSVDVSEAAANHFGIKCTRFVQANVCEPLPSLPIEGPIGLVYSSFALEQMPRIFKVALSNMLSLRPRAIALFEPVPELWGNGLRGLVSRMRVRAIDRLRDVPCVIEELIRQNPVYRIDRMTRSAMAINPHTEMCEIVLVRKSDD